MVLDLNSKLSAFKDKNTEYDNSIHQSKGSDYILNMIDLKSLQHQNEVLLEEQMKSKNEFNSLQRSLFVSSS